MSETEVIYQAFRHFVHLDESNAAVHASRVRYSPITFRLAEVLHATHHWHVLSQDQYEAVLPVLGDLGTYPEDAGR